MWNPFGTKKRPAPPPVVEGDQIVPLTEQDDTYINRSMVLNFMLRFDSVLDPDKLNSSLSTLLNQPGWRKIGARLRLNENEKLEYHIPERFDDNRPSFSASHVDFGASIADHPLASQLPAGAPGDEPCIIGDPRHFWPLMRPGDGPRELEDYLYTDRPQLSLHVVSFMDATLVSLTWPHTLWDAMGRREFLLAWTAVLAGRDARPAYDPDEQPLRGFADNPREEYKLLSKKLSVPQLIVFGLRYWFEGFWYPSEKARLVCLPAAFMHHLRETATAEARAAGNSEDIFLSDGDLISAWCARLLTDHARLSPGQTVCIINALGYRALLQPDVLSPDKAYLCNAAGGVYTHVTAGDVVSLPLSHTASAVRRSIAEQATRGQLEAATHLAAESFKATGSPPVFGDATMQLMVVSNWSKGRFFDMDFSPAIVPGSRTANEGAPAGKPVYIQACAFNKGYSIRNAFQVSGKDSRGNYWLSAMLRTEVWDSVERALRGAAEE